jgi:ribose transport system permease protein
MNRANIQRFLRQNPYLFTLLLLIVAIFVNWRLQDNYLELTVINRNMRTMLPAMILVVGQAIVVLGGGIDLSVGTMMLMVNSILVSWISQDSSTADILLAFVLATGIGMAAGAFNGFCVAYLRLQPIVTTYATGFVFAGIALEALPRPGGGNIPQDWSRFYLSTQKLAFLHWPFAAYMVILLLLLWMLLRSTRYGQYLYATGGSTQAAYTTGVPVLTVRFSSYVFAGMFVGLAAIARTVGTGAANASLALRDGGILTLESITAVVLGGTRLSGGQGGIAGPIFGVALLALVRTIVGSANVSTWYQDLVNALIIVAALAGPGLIRLIRFYVEPTITRMRERAAAS